MSTEQEGRARRREGKEGRKRRSKGWGRTRRIGVLPLTVREVDGRWWGRS